MTQGEMVDSIEANVESASIRVNEGADDLRMAERYQVALAEIVIFLHISSCNIKVLLWIFVYFLLQYESPFLIVNFIFGIPPLFTHLSCSHPYHKR